MPSLPKKNPKRSDQENLNEREVALQVFLNQILDSHELRFSKDLLSFLKDSDEAFKKHVEVK